MSVTIGKISKRNPLLKSIFTISVLLVYYGSFGQYYIRGEVKDEKGALLQNVKIWRPSTKSLFYSGNTGGFGIPSNTLKDSLEFSADGFSTQVFNIRADEYQNIVLHRLPQTVINRKPKLVSITTGKERHIFPTAYYQDETYSVSVENDFVKSDNNSSTGFALRIDKASYSNVRRFIHQKSKVPPDAVRVDEMLNYFNFNYKEPPREKTFNIETNVSDCPWNKKDRLLFVNISGKKLNLDKVPPSNFVFLIDVSGSMDMPNRLPLLKEAFQLLVKNLRQQDTVSIVVYGGTVGTWLPPTSGAEKQKIVQAIEELNAAGDTPGEAAIKSAYRLAEQTFIKGGNNRIILATDGDFNVGQNTEKELEELVTREKQSGVYLTCLGVGMGNYKDSKIEVLAKKGNGNFAYLDDAREAEKILVTEFTQTLYSIANDVYIKVHFNPLIVKEYRLIGYDNNRKVLAENSDELEGGEIGAGTGNTAIFQIVPASADSIADLSKELVTIELHYTEPGDSEIHLEKYSFSNNYCPFSKLDKSLQFASSVAMFGLKIKDSKFFPSDTDWDMIRVIAAQSMNPDEYLQKEFVNLVDKAESIYIEKKKRKKFTLFN